jgi:hypothetical protein
MSENEFLAPGHEPGRNPEPGAGEKAIPEGAPSQLLARLEENTRQLASGIGDIVECIAASEEKIRRIHGGGGLFHFVRRFWRDRRIAKEAEANLSHVRAVAVGALGGLTENQRHVNTLLEHLGARMEWLAHDNLRLKRLVLQMGDALAGRLEEVEEQLSRGRGEPWPRRSGAARTGR